MYSITEDTNNTLVDLKTYATHACVSGAAHGSLDALAELGVKLKMHEGKK